MHYFFKKVKTPQEKGFREAYSCEERKKMYQALKEKDPDNLYVYIILNGLDQFDKQGKPDAQIACERDMSVLRLISVIKKLTLKLNKEIGVFLFINNTIKGMQETIGDIATKDASKDGFLYASLKKEDTF